MYGVVYCREACEHGGACGDDVVNQHDVQPFELYGAGYGVYVAGVDPALPGIFAGLGRVLFSGYQVVANGYACHAADANGYE